MKEKTKEFLKKYLIGFILGIVSACTISVIAATYFPSNDVTYDNKESGLVSTDVQGAIDELYTECTTIPAGDQIIEDAGLEKDPYECRYFFTGANPNNYITFNGEEAGWRIISVECDGTIKIMRWDSIGNMAWDVSNNENWARPASLNTYLNETYYNELNATDKSQIVSKDWSIGAIEKFNVDLEGQVNDENSTKWNGKIALPTVSEYLRTNSNTNCKTELSYYNNSSTCRNTSWMYNNSYYGWWMLTKTMSQAFSVHVYLVQYTGNLYQNSVNDTSIGARPALYLSPNIKITGGDGSQTNPYEISL